MEYNSFYGGRRGASFVIVKNYPSIAEMVRAFKQGGSYKVVNYDEYVLIDTVNKNDKDNGKIYRRGYDYNNDLGGAIYEGQIVGPAGMAPHVEMKTIKEVDALNKTDGLVDEKGNTYRYTKGSYKTTENLIPGKYVENGTNKYNDEISWALCSIRDKNSHETTAHVGFKFPYLVIDYTAESVNPYYNRSAYSETFVNQNLIQRKDDESHPFYENWHISIPKGIKGDALQNFRLISANDVIEHYVGQEDDIAHNRKVLVYDYYHYDKDANGEPKTLYLGDYNMISSVDIDEEGTLTIGYTHEDTQSFNKIFKWIKSISLNGNTGKLIVEYNHSQDKDGNATKYETDLRWVNNIQVAANGQVTLKYTTGADVVLNTKIKWVTKTEVLTGTTEGEGSQKLKITYNTGETAEIGNPLNYIIKTAISDTYHLLVYYADPEKRANATNKATYDGKDDWTDLGYIGNGTGVGAIVGKESDVAVAEVASTMPPYSAWLIVEE